LLTFLIFFETVNSLLSPCYHIVFGVDKILPVDDLIHAQGHRRSNLRRNGGWFNRCYDFMLELPYNIIDEVYGSPGGKHTNRNVIEG